ncbi:MAG: hypothetical protein J3R72DRAFT_422059 [Linnemannia gamsii]|nr:MAG: hypothetical protein J3R72DRAFT_422059 [Linnemannia gamsii]
MSISNCIVPENHTDESSADNLSFRMDSHNNVPTTPTTPHSNSNSASPSNQTRNVATNSEAGVATTTSRNSCSSQTPRASWASLQPFDSEKELEATVSKEIVSQTSLLKKSSDGSSVDELYKSTETKTKKPPPFFDQETREEYEERAFLGKQKLDFDPMTRQQLPTLSLQRFMVSGYCPKRLGEEVFDREPDLTTEGKRKVEMSEADEKAKVKIKLDFDDPFCDTAILYRNTDSYETKKG